MAGLTSDANILINQARVASQRFLYNYQEPMPVEQLVRTLCDYKQAYTQFGGETINQGLVLFSWLIAIGPTTTRYRERQGGRMLICITTDYPPTSFCWGHAYIYLGLRPFGVAFLFAGWDRHHGFQLYESDPAGTFGGWKATAIGQNFQVRDGGGGKAMLLIL